MHVTCCQCDQAREGFFLTHEQMDAYCKDKGFIGWFETSAKENINIDESAKFLLSKVSKEVWCWVADWAVLWICIKYFSGKYLIVRELGPWVLMVVVIVILLECLSNTVSTMKSILKAFNILIVHFASQCFDSLSLKLD